MPLQFQLWMMKHFHSSVAFISFHFVTLQPPLVTEFYQLIETINDSENRTHSFMSVKQSTGWL